MRFNLKLFFLSIFFLPLGGKAQITETSWEIISSQNFDLYLPKSSDLDYYRLLRDAEKHLLYCENLFDFHLNESIRLVLSKNENIVKLPVSSNNSKATEVEFDRHTGYVMSNTDYDEVLLKVKNVIVVILFNDLIYGKSFQDRIQNYALLQVQNWYFKGLAAYCNEPWTGLYDGMLREYFHRGNPPGFNVLIEENETLAGYSFWRFLLDQYGEQNIANTLYISNLTHSMESGLYFVFGKDLKQLMKEWQLYYTVIYKEEFRANESNSHSYILNTEKLQNISISPDGKWLAGVQYEEFTTKVYCLNLKSKYRTIINTSAGTNSVILRWREMGKSNELLYKITTAVNEKIVFYNPSKKRNTRYLEIKDFDRLLNFDIDVENNYVFYGVNKAKTYLVFYSAKTKNIETLSTRITLLDTKLFDNSVYYTMHNGNQGFLIHATKANDTLLQIGSCTVFKILNIDSASIIYMSDNSGLNQVYQFNRVSKSLKALSEFTHNSLSITVSRQNENCYYTKGNFPDIKTSTVLLHELDTSEVPQSFYKLNPKGKIVSLIKNKSEQDSALTIDTTSTTNKKYYFINGFNDEDEKEYVHLLDSIKNVQKEHDISLSISKNYELNFATLKVSLLQFDNTIFFNMVDMAPLSPDGLHNYYSFHYLKSEMALKDILNKYQILGGFRLSTSLGGGYDAYIKMEKIFRRYTLQASVYYFQKKNIVVNGEDVLKHQIQSTSVSYNYKYSNTITLKVGGTVMPFSNTILSTERNGLVEKGNAAVICGFNTEIQYYRLKKYGDFLYRGINLQIQPTAYYNSTTSNINGLIKVIVKYYKPVYRRIIWSNQLLVNASFGKDKILNIIGGSENWILMQYDQQNQYSKTTNYQLRLFGGGIRGFKQNARNGANSFCLNSELRIPISSFFSKWPTEKFWYQRFILIPFADLGTAWNGFNPFDKSNSYTTRIFDYNTSATNNTRVEVKNLRNPLIGSFGLGINTRLLGYNIRFDFAYGVEDGKIKKPMLMFSYGTNF